MPIHDWTRVSAGDFHDFHQTWTGTLRTRLNEGILPDGFYAQVEQQASGIIPDVLTLQYAESQEPGADDLPGALAIDVAPPQVRFTADLERRTYTERKNQLVIRHVSENRVVALIELVSSGNKSNEREFRRLLDKLIAALDQGIHLLVVDLYPPTSRDPEGIHAALWAELGEATHLATAERPLTVASYVAGPRPRVFLEPLAVGDALRDMPLVLRATHYVLAPLEQTYMQAFHGSPPHVKRLLQATPT